MLSSIEIHARLLLGAPEDKPENSFPTRRHIHNVDSKASSWVIHLLGLTGFLSEIGRLGEWITTHHSSDTPTATIDNAGNCRQQCVRVYICGTRKRLKFLAYKISFFVVFSFFSFPFFSRAISQPLNRFNTNYSRLPKPLRFTPLKSFSSIITSFPNGTFF